MIRKLSRIAIILLTALVTIISMANMQPVSLNILFFTFQVPLIVLIIILLLTGFSAGYVLKGVVDHRKRKKAAGTESSTGA